MNLYNSPYHNFDISSSVFLITGGAGFIGSNLVEYLLNFNAAKVRVLDNYSTGSIDNIKEFLNHPRFEIIEGDIRNPDTCKAALFNVDYLLHQAALGSVPRSVHDPITTNSVNIGGFLNVLTAAKDTPTLKRMVYAASSSTYGDHVGLPKIEDRIGSPLSPYAVTKLVNELYANVFAKVYGFPTIGLRYFNVFGPRQSPSGEYAAVIPRFIKAAAGNERPVIFGDGMQTRDFTFISNVVQANIRALQSPINGSEVFNIACGFSTSLNDLWNIIKDFDKKEILPQYVAGRSGDIPRSLADISKARALLSYNPEVQIQEGLKITYNWFINKLK